MYAACPFCDIMNKIWSERKRSMRRKNREVTEFDRIREIIDGVKVARLGMNDNGKVYVVPMNYGYETGESKELVFYFHCAKVGRKIDVLKENPQVCLELDGCHELLSAEVPCAYSYYFASLIGNGEVEFVENMKEKEYALSMIMKHQTGKNFQIFDEKLLDAVCILKIRLKDYEVKEHRNTENL